MWAPTFFQARRGALAAAVLGLGACAVMPPAPPAAVPWPATYAARALPGLTEAPRGPGGGAQRFDAGPAPAAEPWWTAFGSPRIDRWVAQALDANPTLDQARQRLAQARQDWLAQTGATDWPQLDAALDPSRQKLDPAAYGLGPPLVARAPRPFTLLSARVGVSYSIDLFGANRAAGQALADEAEAQRFNLQAARLTLAANVVSTAVHRASTARQLALATRLLEDQQAQLGIVTDQLAAGGVPETTRLDRQQQLEATRASVAVLCTQLAQDDHLLAILLGQPPAGLPADGPDSPTALDLDDLQLPARLPVSVPSALARQRPDIQAAAALLAKAGAQVGVATANLYPQLTLSASAGPQGTDLRSRIDVWSIGAGLTQPIFHGGALQAERRSAEAAYAGAAAAYRQTVLQALQQVADALSALQEDARALESRDAAQRAAETEAAIAGQRAQAGGFSRLAVLAAQAQALLAAQQRAQVQAQRLADTVALYAALGTP